MRIYPQITTATVAVDTSVHKSRMMEVDAANNEPAKSTVRYLGSRCCENVSHQRHRRAI